MCRMKKLPNELYSVIPVGRNSRPYQDIFSHTICHWVYIAGRFTVCEFSRQVYSEFVKYVHILCIRVHSVGQFVYHGLSSGMYLVLGFSFALGLYVSFFFWGTFIYISIQISFFHFLSNFLSLHFYFIVYLSVNLFNSRNRIECYVVWYMTIVCVCVLLFPMAKAVGSVANG